MIEFNNFSTRGQVVARRDAGVAFQPAGTQYEIHLGTARPYDGPIGKPVRAIVRGTARKIWTVPSGGNFVTPIVGEPRIVQGRIRALDERCAVVQAGVIFIVDLPADAAAIDLASGAVALNAMVNCVILPGASLELVRSEVAHSETRSTL
ncbi:MAG: hypothetical protein ACREJC_09520 [Tepidisphaeraceae bacterium]